MKPQVLLIIATVPFLNGPAAADETPADWKLETAGGIATLSQPGRPDVFRYLTEVPAGSALAANSACCFHPFTTPAGHAVTAFAPDDHRHHRGIFLAWVEMHGAADADFWGWGAHAPMKGRRIVNRSLTARPGGFRAVNEWRADDLVLIGETLDASARQSGSANILDLTYTLQPTAGVTLAQWAFSGFCVRFPKEGEVVMHSPSGVAAQPNPAHDRPETNWPDAPWYAATWKTTTGAEIGVAVVPRGAHPAQTWHCHRDLRMLNPAITAPAAVTLRGGVETVLRYQVVAFDGAPPVALLNELAANPPEENLAGYRAELAACRAAHGGSCDVPDVKFFLFGMGARTKLLYRDGILFDARSGRELQRWKVRREVIVPSDYAVFLESEDGSAITLREDSEAVWIEQGGQRIALDGTKSTVKLPDFAGKKFPRVLRVLHQELLVNIVGAGPVPNFFAYEKPWYRDGAMVALALQETGNLDLLKPWILGLREPFDRNNKGETEADNLGQALFLVSLVADKNHPLVAKVLAEVPRFEKSDATGKFILGRSDFSDHPVYQTKWLKYGLRALGLPDPYIIPKVADSYGALFWMDYREQHSAGKDSDDRGPYPYLGWACDHFHGTKKSPLSNRDYPLTWEQNASEARYDGLKIIAPIFTEKRLSPPHTWHGAEAFLLLLAE